MCQIKLDAPRFSLSRKYVVTPRLQERGFIHNLELKQPSGITAYNGGHYNEKNNLCWDGCPPEQLHHLLCRAEFQR